MITTQGFNVNPPASVPYDAATLASILQNSRLGFVSGNSLAATPSDASVAAIANANADSGWLKGLLIAAQALGQGYKERGNKIDHKKEKEEDRQNKLSDDELAFNRRLHLASIPKSRSGGPLEELNALIAQERLIGLRNANEANSPDSWTQKPDDYPDDDPLPSEQPLIDLSLRPEELPSEEERFTSRQFEDPRKVSIDQDHPFAQSPSYASESFQEPIDFSLLKEDALKANNSSNDQNLIGLDENSLRTLQDSTYLLNQVEPDPNAGTAASGTPPTPTEPTITQVGSRVIRVTNPDGSGYDVDKFTSKKLHEWNAPASPTAPASVPPNWVQTGVTINSSGKPTTTYGPPQVDMKEAGMVPKEVTVKQGQTTTKYEPDESESDESREIEAAENWLANVETIQKQLNNVLRKEEEAWAPAVGKWSKWVKWWPGQTAADDISLLMEAIQSDVAFKALAKMRRESKTGSALGSISDKENKLLAAAEGSIDTGLSRDLFRENVSGVLESREKLAELLRGKLDKYYEEHPEKQKGRSLSINSQVAKDISTQIKKVRESISKLSIDDQDKRAELLDELSELNTRYIKETGKPWNLNN